MLKFNFSIMNIHLKMFLTWISALSAIPVVTTSCGSYALYYSACPRSYQSSDPCMYLMPSQLLQLGADLCHWWSLALVMALADPTEHIVHCCPSSCMEQLPWSWTVTQSSHQTSNKTYL